MFLPERNSFEVSVGVSLRAPTALVGLLPWPVTLKLLSTVHLAWKCFFASETGECQMAGIIEFPAAWKEVEESKNFGSGTISLRDWNMETELIEVSKKECCKVTQKLIQALMENSRVGS